jgi:hypothetical protein
MRSNKVHSSYLLARCRESCNGTTRHYTLFRGDTGRNDSNLYLTFQFQCAIAVEIKQARCNHSYSDSATTPQQTQQTRIKLGLPIIQEELPVITSRWPCQSIPLAMKLRDIQLNKRHVHSIKIKHLCRHFPYYTSRKGTRTT